MMLTLMLYARLLMLLTFVVTVMLLSACATSIPTYPQTPADTVLQSVAANFTSIKTVSGPCRVTLVSEAGESITLSAAIAARPPDHLRLRAWKFDRAIFDATIIGVDVWLVPIAQADSPGADALPQIPSHEIAGSMSLLSGQYFNDAHIVSETAEIVTVTGSSRELAAIECDIDRRTRTPRIFRFTQLNQPGTLASTLLMDEYRFLKLKGNTPPLTWPGRLHFERGAASITIFMDDVVINDELPQTAFKPPARAVKQQ